MLDLNELEQLIAFADTGTLSKVAEAFHISTPSVTRSMKNIEEEFGVFLFHRTKNRIELNETGKVAVECARKLLEEADHAVQRVRTYDAELKTITVKSCAPAPLWKLLMPISGNDNLFRYMPECRSFRSIAPSQMRTGDPAFSDS